MRVSVRDLDLWFDVVGCPTNSENGGFDDRPTVVMLHGALGDHSAGMALAAKLSRIARVIMLDQRGHGQSSLSDASHWNLATWADDIAGFCAVLGIERPVIYGRIVWQHGRAPDRHSPSSARFKIHSVRHRRAARTTSGAWRRFASSVATSLLMRLSVFPIVPTTQPRARHFCKLACPLCHAVLGKRSLP